MSLRGPVKTLTARRKAPSLMGQVGRGGRMGQVNSDKKFPLNFFILYGYIDYVYVYLYTK